MHREKKKKGNKCVDKEDLKVIHLEQEPDSFPLIQTPFD